MFVDDLPPFSLNDGINPSEFKMIYPLYLNSNRTQQQGRRIGKEKAVPDPNIREIEQALAKINGARIILEPQKRHPREINFEQPQFLGRVRVSLPPNCEIKNKHYLLLYVASEISKMERKKFKVQQIVEQQPEQTSQSTNAKSQNPKKSGGNRKRNNRKK